MQHQFFEAGCSIANMLEVQVNFYQPIGVALFDYCVKAGMGSGPFAGSAQDIMNSLRFIIDTEHGTHIIDPHRKYNMSDVHGSIKVYLMESVLVVDPFPRPCPRPRRVLSESNC